MKRSKYICDSLETSEKFIRIVERIVGCYAIKNKTNNKITVTMHNKFEERFADELYRLCEGCIEQGIKILGLSKKIKRIK